jgi:WD40 repeat protein
VYTGGGDNCVRVWDIHNSACLLEIKCHAEDKGGIVCVDVSLDNKLVASAGQDKNVRLFNASTGQLIYFFEVLAPPTQVRFSVNALYLIVSDESGTINVFSTKQGKFFRTMTR